MKSDNVKDYVKVKKIREGVGAIDTLPTIPVTLEKIFSILEDENKSARDLENIIKYDQSLSAKIISVANSAFYGLRMQVTTISRAVVAIGFTEFKNLAISIAQGIQEHVLLVDCDIRRPAQHLLLSHSGNGRKTLAFRRRL